MTEVLTPPTSLAFANISPALFIDVPNGVLVDYLPSDSENLHQAVTRSLAFRPLPKLLAEEPGLEQVPWDKPHRIPDYTDSLTKWERGLQTQLSDLEVMELYLDPDWQLTTDDLSARLALTGAVSAYRTLLGVVTKVEKWTEPERQAAQRHLVAELISPNKVVGWGWWNLQAINHTKRKIEFANAALDA